MDIIRQAKHAYYNSLERLYPNKLIFHHVPKCGGSSVGRALRKRFLFSFAKFDETSVWKAAETGMASGRFDRDSDAADLFRRMMLSYHATKGTACVQAHVQFDNSVHRAFAEKYKFITMLREPVDRFLSAYYYDFGRDNRNRIDVSLDEFAESDRGCGHGRLYAYFFAGAQPGADWFQDRASIDAAKANLQRLDVVGLVEDMAGFQKMVSDRTKIRLDIGHVNKGEGRDRAAALSPETRARVEEACAPDLEIYDYAVQLAQSAARTPVEEGAAPVGERA